MRALGTFLYNEGPPERVLDLPIKEIQALGPQKAATLLLGIAAHRHGDLFVQGCLRGLKNRTHLAWMHEFNQHFSGLTPQDAREAE